MRAPDGDDVAFRTLTVRQGKAHEDRMVPIGEGVPLGVDVPDAQRDRFAASDPRRVKDIEDGPVAQAELGLDVGAGQSVVSSYERERLRIHPTKLVKLTQVLQITADELLGIASNSR